MRTIGLIGGMSWESTAVYYRRINELVRDRLGGLSSAEIAMRSVDFDRIVRLQRANRWEEAGRLLAEAAAALETAGADCILICTNTMHLVADAVAARCSAPLIHIVDETARALATARRRRPLLLATRYTMEQPFYRDRMKACAGIEILIPDEADRGIVHDVIFEELCRGVVRDNSRAGLIEIIERGMAGGADSVILGCTEIGLLLDPDALPCPGFDSTEIHARAAVDFALETASAERNAA